MAALSTLYYYNTGTVSVSAGGTTVTGSGTSWTASLQAGDTLSLAGLEVRIKEVVSATSLTLLLPWPGAAQAGASYSVIYTSPARSSGLTAYDKVSSLIAQSAVILSGVTTYSVVSATIAAPPTTPVTGDAYLLTVTPTGAWAGYSGYIATWTGTGWSYTAPISGMSAHAQDSGLRWLRTSGGSWVVMAGTILGTVSQVSGVQTGALVERGTTAAGVYVRFAGGLQLAWGGIGSTSTSAETTWTFPAVFSATPRIILSPGSPAGTLYSGAWSAASTTSTSFSFFSASGARVNTYGHIAAIGVWY